MLINLSPYRYTRGRSGVRPPYKLVAFDLDGTLVEQVSSWGTLHRYFGTEAAVEGDLSAYEHGEIDYAEFMRRDIAPWPKPLHISTVQKALTNYTLAPGAELVVRELERRGYKVAIISGGIDILASQVAERLSISKTVANGLAADSDGYLTGEGILRVDPINKHLVLKHIAKEWGLTLSECVAVGDGMFDGNFLKHAGLGVAIGSNVKLRMVAGVIVPSLKAILKFL
ncbi:MAG: HAD-IB family phosphatase [Candidatus Bathyarchaeia archaeon]